MKENRKFSMTVTFMVLFMLCIGTVAAYDRPQPNADTEPSWWTILFSKTFAFITCPSGFDYCWDSSYSAYGTLAHAEIYITNLRSDGSYANDNYVKNAFINVGYEGDKLYVAENYATWDAIFNQCGENGCNLPEIAEGRYILASGIGDTYSGCPVFVAWDKDVDTGTGAWSQTSAVYGWIGSGNCFDISIVECNYDMDCDSDNCEASVCVDSKDYILNMDIEYTYIAPNTVWQYIESIDLWFVYHHDNPSISNMIVTSEQWDIIIADTCTDECSIEQKWCVYNPLTDMYMSNTCGEYDTDS